MLTALSTPEGLPWITLSPWKAHSLITSRSSAVHLKTQKFTFTAVRGGGRGPQGRRGRGHRLGWVETKGKGVRALELRKKRNTARNRPS